MWYSANLGFYQQNLDLRDQGGFLIHTQVFWSVNAGYPTFCTYQSPLGSSISSWILTHFLPFTGLNLSRAEVAAIGFSAGGHLVGAPSGFFGREGCPQSWFHVWYGGLLGETPRRISPCRLMASHPLLSEIPGLYQVRWGWVKITSYLMKPGTWKPQQGVILSDNDGIPDMLWNPGCYWLFWWTNSPSSPPLASNNSFCP